MIAELISRGLIASRQELEEAIHPLFALLGGAPFFMSALENAFYELGVPSVYAFSKRVSVEEVQPDGTVRKTNVFRHTRFIHAIVV